MDEPDQNERGGATLPAFRLSLPQIPAGAIVLRDLLDRPRVAGRACGGCTVCCDVVGVAELGKPFFARCKHNTETACRIYENRPTGCRNYMCMWLLGYFPDEARPDKSRLLFSPEAEGLHAYVLREPENIAQCIDAILADTNGFSCGSNGERVMIVLNGQQIRVGFPTPDYDNPDTGEYKTKLCKQSGREFVLGAGPWRSLLHPRTEAPGK